MNQYTITYCQDTPDWNTVPSLEMTHKYLQTPEDVRAWAQIAYNDKAILVHLWSDVSQIRAVETEKLGAPYEDSCLEFFFSPVPGDPRYINIEMNFNKCMYLGVGTGLSDLTRLIPDQEENPLRPQTAKTATGWELTYEVPYAFIRRFFPNFTVEAGMTIRANCFTCADLADKPYYKSWSEVPTEDFTFHCTKSFGYMMFSKS